MAQGATAAPATRAGGVPGARGVHLDRGEAARRREGEDLGRRQEAGGVDSDVQDRTSATWSSEYNKVIGYRRATWTLAAYFRTGYLYEIFSKALLERAVSAGGQAVRAPKACDLYRDQIEQAVAGVDEEAVKRYGVTLQKAGELGVSNEWTRLARTRANAYKPDVFPMVKDERIDMQLESP